MILRLAHSAGLLAAAAAMAAAASVAPGGERQSLSLTLQQALPYRVVGQRQELWDLHVGLRLQENGKVDANGWAWSPASGPLEHPVRVVRSSVSDDEVTLTLEVTVRHALPRCIGGSGRMVVRCQRDGGRLRGSYDANFTAPGKAETLQLWRRLGGGSDCPITHGLQARATESVTRVPRRYYGIGGDAAQPVLALGKIRTLATCKADPNRPAILTGTVEALRKGLGDGSGSESAARLRKHLSGECPPSFQAAGLAMLKLAGDRQGSEADTLRAASKALSALETARKRGKLEAVDLSRDLVAVAVATELAGSDWPGGYRYKIAEQLAGWSRWLALQELPADTDRLPLAEGGVFHGIADQADARLAMLRAAQGLAALAAQRAMDDLVANGQIEQADANLPACREIARRSVRRFLQSAVGESGAPTGQAGFTEAVSIVVPYVLAERNATGVDIAAGTPARQIARWGLVTRGIGMDGRRLDEQADWLPAAGLVADRQGRAGVLAAMADAPAWSSPWPALLACVLAGSGDKASPLELPAAAIDRTMGSIVLRSGDGKDWLTIFHAATGPRRAAQRRGHFTLYGLGRHWVHPADDRPVGAWPEKRWYNALQTYDALLTGHKGVVPLGPGRLQRIRADRQGGGSLSMLATGFEEVPDEKGRTSGGDVDDARLWRTVGVDTSGRCGAPMLLVTVGGASGLKDRRRIWEINVGDVSARQVRIEGRRFVVSPEGTDAALAGTMVYPPTGYVTYQPPKEGRGGRILCSTMPPGKTNDQMLEQSMDDMLADVRKLAEGVDWQEPNDVDIDIDAAFNLPKDKQNRQQDQKDGQVVLNKLYRHTSSVKMGGTDRFIRAVNNCVMVLTVQKGDPPKVTVADREAPVLLHVGPVRVRYREYLLTFHGEEDR